MANIIKVPGKTKTKKKSAKSSVVKKRIIIAVIVLALAGLSVWVYFEYFNSHPVDNTSQVEDKKVTAANKNANQILNQVESSIEAGDKSVVISAFDQSIKETDDNYTQAALYYNKALSLERLGDKEAALEAGLTAYEVDKDGRLAADIDTLVGNLAYELGQKEVALKHYSRQRDRIKREGQVDIGNPLPALEAIIKELESELE